MSTQKITGWRNRPVESDTPLGNAFATARGLAGEKAFNGQYTAISQRASAKASRLGTVPSLSIINTETETKTKAKPALGAFATV